MYLFKCIASPTAKNLYARIWQFETQKLLPQSESYVCYSSTYQASMDLRCGTDPATSLFGDRRMGLVACSFYQDVRELPLLGTLGYQ